MDVLSITASFQGNESDIMKMEHMVPFWTVLLWINNEHVNLENLDAYRIKKQFNSSFVLESRFNKLKLKRNVLLVCSHCMWVLHTAHHQIQRLWTPGARVLRTHNRLNNRKVLIVSLWLSCPSDSAEKPREKLPNDEKINSPFAGAAERPPSHPYTLLISSLPCICQLPGGDQEFLSDETIFCRMYVCFSICWVLVSDRGGKLWI